MIDNDLANIFDDCLNRLAAGETVEQVLRRYAAYDAALRPLLQTVRLAQRALPGADEIAPARSRGRARVLEALADTPPVRMVARPKAAASRWWVGLAALLLVALGIGAVTANSLPGDPLYGLKRGVEDAATSLSADPQAAREAAQGRRVDEIFMLIALGRPEAVEFEGEVEALAGDQWRIGSLTVLLTDDTLRPNNVRLGDRVSVAADVTVERTLIAREIRLLQAALEATAEPIAATPVATIMPRPSATAQPSSTPQPTLTASATPTQTTAPTRTPQPSATHTPAETALPSLRAGCTPQRPAGWVTYSVRSGDSLSSLASATGATVDTIVQANCLPTSGLIVVDQPLYLPLIPPTRPPAISAPTSVSTPATGGSAPPVAGSNDDDDSDTSGSDDDNSGPGSSGDSVDDDSSGDDTSSGDSVDDDSSGDDDNSGPGSSGDDDDDSGSNDD